MPSLNNDNSVGIKVITESDDSGIEQSTNSLENLGKVGESTNKSVAEMADNFSDGMKKVSVATGVAGAGLSLYAKSASNYLVGLVKDSKALAMQTGMTVEQSSELSAAFQHMGINADQTSIAFRTLVKNIQTQRDGVADSALKQQDLTNKIGAAKIQIATYTTEINKNGDASGALRNKVESLGIQLKTYEKQLSDTNGPLEKLHISTQNADGSNRSFNDILMNVADRFQQMPDGVEKSADAVQLFGRQGTGMIKVLNQGSQGIMELEDNAKKLGITLTQDNIIAVNRYIESQKKLSESSNALKLQVGSLTTPLLANLNLRMNQLAQAALSPHSPIRALTVDVLAFGGPILGATSAVTAFLGNIASAAPVLGRLRIALAAVVAVLQSPWIVAISAAVIGLGFLAEKIFHTKSETDNLTVAQNNLKQSTNDLKVAQDNLATAHLNEQGAALAVEGAQRNYNQAVKDFGPDSFEARDALYNLNVAQHSLTDAQNATKDSLQAYSDKQKEVAKNQELIAHMQDTKDKIDGVTRSAEGAVISINKLAQNVKDTNAMGTKIDLSPLLKKARGGPVRAGESYVVGDNPDGSLNSTSEIFVPDQSGTIMPASQTRNMVNSGEKISNQTSTQVVNHRVTNIHNLILPTIDAVRAFFEESDQDMLNISKGLAANRGARL